MIDVSLQVLLIKCCKRITTHLSPYYISNTHIYWTIHIWCDEKWNQFKNHRTRNANNIGNDCRKYNFNIMHATIILVSILFSRSTIAWALTFGSGTRNCVWKIFTWKFKNETRKNVSLRNKHTYYEKRLSLTNK